MQGLLWTGEISWPSPTLKKFPSLCHRDLQSPSVPCRIARLYKEVSPLEHVINYECFCRLLESYD